MVFGSTFGTFNAAYAVDVADKAIITGATTGVSGGAIVFTAATDDPDDAGFIATMNAAAGDFSVASITDEDGAASVITIDNGIVTVTGNITGIADISGDTAMAFTITDDGELKVMGSTVEADQKTLDFNIEGVTGVLEFGGSETQAIAGVIDGVGDAKGILKLSGTGAKNFSGIIGGAGEDELLLMETTATAGLATFAATLDVVTITNLGSIKMDAATKFTTLTNSGTASINEAVDGTTGLASIVMHTADSVLNFNSVLTRDLDMVVTGTTDGFGTINVINTAGGAAAAQVTSGGDIGEADKHIGTINIGSATAAGALTTLNGDEIHVDTLNIVGGDATNEDSILIAAEHVTANTGIVLTAADKGDAELNISTAATITGDITVSGVDGAGNTIIDVDNATTFVGSIGDSTASVEIMTVATGTATLKGATNAIESLTITGDGITVDFLGTVDQTFTGAITTGTDDHAVLTNSNVTGTVTFTGLIGVENARMKSITLDDNTDTTFNSAISTLDLDIDTAAADDVTTFAVGGHVIGDNGTTGGALNVAGGTFVLGTAIVDGVIVFDTKEVGTTDAGVELRALVIQPSASFTSGTVTFIDGATLATDTIDAADVAALSVTDTALTDFTVNATAAVADITITATAKSSATTASEMSVTTNVGASLQQAVVSSTSGSDTTAINAFNDNITSVNGGSLAVASELGKQIAPQDDMISGSTFATKAMTGSLQGIMSNRMASLRSGDAFMTGMSAGNGMSANSGFIQAFGTEAEQKNKTVGSGTQFGYDASSAGLALGFDGITDNGSVVGLSFSMSETDVDGKGTGNSKNDIDSYTASIYMDKTTDAGYIEGSLTVGLNENNSSRIVNTAGLNRTYKGDYDSEQVSLKIGGGMPNAVGTGFVTPYGSVTATRITTDAYTETSTTASDALRLRVAQDDVDSIVGTVGLKYHTVLDNGGTPMISLAINNEFGDNTINSTNTYQGGGTAFNTSTDVEELSATLGLGYSFRSDNTTLELAYEADANDDDYLGHYGSIKIVSKF